MTKSPIFWFVLGVGSVWAFHHWGKALPGAKAS